MQEQLYADFTTKLLPKIQEGVMITKEYFTDLFTRYVHFLFIVDVLSAVLFFLGAVALSILIIKVAKWASREDEWDNAGPIMLSVFGGLTVLVFIGFSIESTINAIKDKYIPEIRVLEKIQAMRSSD